MIQTLKPWRKRARNINMLTLCANALCLLVFISTMKIGLIGWSSITNGIKTTPHALRFFDTFFWFTPRGQCRCYELHVAHVEANV